MTSCCLRAESNWVVSCVYAAISTCVCSNVMLTVNCTCHYFYGLLVAASLSPADRVRGSVTKGPAVAVMISWSLSVDYRSGE